jgi:uncharacterized Zn finger protein
MQQENNPMASYGWYRPSVPKKVDNGIKAVNKRGAFGREWWGKEWIMRLERFNDSARLGRGRAYARKGQVTGLSVTSSGVTAKVQGSRTRPYSVSIRLTPYSEEEHQRLLGVLGLQPVLVARMLGKEMPEAIAGICRKEGLPLFPASFRDIEASCSCPDYAVPCKHLAAVFYLLAEAFDRDPFLLFTLRGVEKDALFKALGGTLSLDSAPESKRKKKIAEPLPPDPESFWHAAADLSGLAALCHEEVNLPAVLVRRLGPVPFWRSERDFIAEMELMYKSASARIGEIRRQSEAAEAESRG